MEQFTTTEQIELGNSKNRKLSNKQLISVAVIVVVIVALVSGLLIWQHANKKNDHILPLGTVVKLKKGNVKLVIVGRAQLYDNNGAIGYFDYSALGYPQGVVSQNEFAFFNAEDIDEVYFEGYRDETEKEFADSYEEKIKEVPYPKLSVDSFL